MNSLYRPCDIQEDGFPRFNNNRSMNVVNLSALRTGRIYSLGNIPCTHFCLSQPQCHSAAGRIMLVKNSIYVLWNRPRDPEVYRAVPQSTACLSAPMYLFI